MADFLLSKHVFKISRIDCIEQLILFCEFTYFHGFYNFRDKYEINLTP